MKLQSKKLIFQAITCFILSFILSFILTPQSLEARGGGGGHGGGGSREDATSAANAAAERAKNNLDNPNDANLLVNPYDNGVVVPETVVVPNTTSTPITTTPTTPSPNAPITPTTPTPNALPANAKPLQEIQGAPQSNQDNGASTFKKIPDN